MCSINFIATNKKLLIDGDNNYLFVNSTETIKFKAKHSEIVAHPICLGYASVDDPSKASAKNLDYIEMFLILVLIINLLRFMIY